MIDPAVMFKDLLETAGVGTFAATSGWSIIIGEMIDDGDFPDTAIAIAESGGEGANPKWLLDFPHVQVRVRGAPNGYQATRTKVAEVQDALLGIASQDVTGGRLVSVTAIGGINPLGFDSHRRPDFTLNFRLITEPDASALTNRDPL